MQTISINFVVPQGLHELSDKQLRYAYSLIASDFASDEIKTLCLLQWSGTKVIGRQDSGSYLLKKGKILFEVTPLTLAELLPHLDWLGTLPTVPVVSRKSTAPMLSRRTSQKCLLKLTSSSITFIKVLCKLSRTICSMNSQTSYTASPSNSNLTSASTSSTGSPRSKTFSLAVTPTFFNLYLPPPAAISSACCSSTSFSISFIMLSKSDLSSVSMFILLFLIAIFH